MGCFIFGGGGKKADGDNLDFSRVTMEPQFGLAGKKFYNKNKELKTGTILNWDGTPLTLADGETIPGADVVEPSLSRRYIPSGKYLGKPVELAPMAQGSVSVSFLDSHSYEIAQTAGYIHGITELVALPEGKVLADGTYEGPYEVGIPNAKYYYLQTAGQMCTQNIKINKPVVTHTDWVTPKNSTTIEIPLDGLLSCERLYSVTLFADDAVSSGQLVSAYLEKGGSSIMALRHAYKEGTGPVAIGISSWVDDYANEKSIIQITGVSFKTTIEYYIVMHTINSNEWNL